MLGVLGVLVVVLGGLVVLRAGDSGSGDGGPVALGERTTQPGDVGPSGAPGASGQGDGDQADAGWTAPAQSEAQGLVANDEVVCWTTSDGVLSCVDGATGEQRFTTQVGSPTAPVLTDGTLLVGSASSLRAGLQAFSLEGEELWSAPVEIGSADRLPVVDGVVAVVDGLTGGELVGIDIATGQERWRTYTGDDPQAATVIGNTLTDGERFYVGMETDGDGPETQVAAIDPATGEETWRAPLGPELAAFIIFDDIAGSADGSTVTFAAQTAEGGHLVTLDTASGELLWSAALTGTRGSLVQVDETTILADGADLVALDHDHEELWAVPVPGAIPDPSVPAGELVHDGGHVYLVGYDVHEIDPGSGDLRPVAEGVMATDVAVVDDLLVVAGAMQIEARPLAGPSGPSGPSDPSGEG